MRWLIGKIRRAIALFGLNDTIVCEESQSMGLLDFHDYHDSIDGQPWHMMKMKCKRCGKEFLI